MICPLIAFTLGAASALALSVLIVTFGLQCFTKYPYRWGWRAHAGRIGVQLPNGDPRLETRARPGPVLLAAV